jgi:hypothetical protein
LGATGSPGALGTGGGGGAGIGTSGDGGGGGGGGYYGGGGGGGGASGGGGGGGSGFGPSGVVFNSGVRSGDGLVTITYTEAPPADTTPPKVTDTSPLQPKKSDNLTATFSEPVTNVSTQTFFLERNIAVKKAPPKYVRVDATVTPSADGLTAELNPVQDLPKGDYRATITTDVVDLADNNLDQNSVQEGNQPKVWFFTVKK